MEKLKAFLTLYSAPDKTFSRKGVIDALYQNIEEWLRPILDENLATLTRIPVRRVSDWVCVDTLRLGFRIRRPQEVTFTPCWNGTQLWVTVKYMDCAQVLSYDPDPNTWNVAGPTPGPFDSKFLAEKLLEQLSWGCDG